MLSNCEETYYQFFNNNEDATSEERTICELPNSEINSNYWQRNAESSSITSSCSSIIQTWNLPSQMSYPNATTKETVTFSDISDEGWQEEGSITSSQNSGNSNYNSFEVFGNLIGSSIEVISSCNQNCEPFLSQGELTQLNSNWDIKSEPEGIESSQLNCDVIGARSGEILPNFPVPNNGFSEIKPEETIASISEAAVKNENDLLRDAAILAQQGPEVAGKRFDESVKFALWALKSMLPQNKTFDDNDQGSILHVAAEYIEELIRDINSYLRYLGIPENNFWEEFKQVADTTTMPIKEKTVKSRREKEEVRRPPNAFIRFSVEFRKMVARDFPNRSNREISQVLGSIWRKMRQEDKEPFIEGFYEELKKTRLEHPEWNYAGKNPKRWVQDLAEIQPERLRPRSNIPSANKSVVYEAKRQMRLPTKKNKKQKLEIVFWVQCDVCSKWRKIPTEYRDNLPEKWTCNMNPDQNRNGCQYEEDH